MFETIRDLLFGLLELLLALLDRPWALLLIALAPAVALAYWKKIYPHTTLVWGLVFAWGLSALPLLEAFVPLDRLREVFGVSPWALPALSVDLFVALAALVDLMSLPNKRSFSAERSAGRVVSLGKKHEIELSIYNRANRSYRVSIRDDVDPEFSPEPDTFDRTLPPHSRLVLGYRLIPSARGAFEIRGVYVRAFSGLRFWKRDLFLHRTTELHVYPDLKQLAEYALLARTNRLSLMGVKRARKIGSDNEFERLRDYLPDDNYKFIDWRTTARRSKLTVKDFTVTQSQNIVFLLDCGRMMTNKHEGYSLLDHALNAVLLMSYVALEKGDSVGLICFSDQVHRYVPPAGGKRQMNRLIHAVFNQFPTLVESRYDEAFVYLANHCRKRSLVVLATNVIDELNAAAIEKHLRTLVGKHLPLGILMRDHAIFDRAKFPVPPEDLFPAAVAADLILWRQQLLVDLEHQGVLTIDAFPEEMTAPLVNRYLEVKARHLL
jgi:uncharacterized protein (DUF58 family)